MKTVGIVASSDAQKEEYRDQNDELFAYLEGIGSKVILSNCIYEKNGPLSGTGKERAAELMKFFGNPEIDDIYDISGGDIANQILEELDYEVIRRSRATFWGYSDLTTVINAIFTMTGKSSVLYQVKNLAWEEKELQRRRFESEEALFRPAFRFVRGESMEGIVIGGNIRCFLKLSGTRYFPDVRDKVLLLESLGGEVPQMITSLSQLKQLGVFDQISGILLGTFTQMEAKKCQPDIIALVKEFTGEHVPIAHTEEIGHGKDSKAIRIGERIRIIDH